MTVPIRKCAALRKKAWSWPRAGLMGNSHCPSTAARVTTRSTATGQNRWLVNLGRLKTSGGLARLGRGSDPWAELAAELVEHQNDDGSWGGGTWSSGIFQIQLTASGVIFLSAATAKPERGK
jgi:hypothetical protein